MQISAFLLIFASISNFQHPTCGFLDSNIERQKNAFLGRPVLSPQFVLESKKTRVFIVIGSRNYYEEISKTILDYGFIEGIDFLKPI